MVRPGGYGSCAHARQLDVSYRVTERLETATTDPSGLQAIPCDLVSSVKTRNPHVLTAHATDHVGLPGLVDHDRRRTEAIRRIVHQVNAPHLRREGQRPAVVERVHHQRPRLPHGFVRKRHGLFKACVAGEGDPAQPPAQLIRELRRPIGRRRPDDRPAQ